MLAVRRCGPRVIARPESIGTCALEDLTDRDPNQLVNEVNIAASHDVIGVEPQDHGRNIDTEITPSALAGDVVARP
jgi:hypothetical protein